MIQIPADNRLIVSEIVRDLQMNSIPRFCIFDDMLYVNTARNADEHENLYIRFYGCVGQFYWTIPPQMLFNPADNMLEACLFTLTGTTIPEERHEMTAQTWLNLIPVRGNLKLIPETVFFTDETWHLEHMVASTDRGLSIITLFNGYNEHYRNPIRLNVNRDFDLLINDGFLSGWIFHCPTHYITRTYQYGDKIDQTTQKILQPFLKKYMELIWYIDNDEDGPEKDLIIKSTLLDLSERLNSIDIHCSQVVAFRESIERRLKWL